jgi:hypothetical protein
MYILRKFLVVIIAVAFATPVATPAATMVFHIAISGAQETPPNASTATGLGTITVDTSTLKVSYDISFSPLVGAETAAHFHGPAARGLPAGILYPLPVGSPIAGSVFISPTELADLLNGLWYVNIHSTVFPGGEIRGQIDCIFGNDCGAVPVDPTTWGAIKALYR